MATAKDIRETIKKCLKDVQVFLQRKGDWCSLQERQEFLSGLHLDPSIEPLLQTFLYVPAVSRCIIQEDCVCLVKCYNTALEKLKKIVASCQQASLAELDSRFQEIASKAEQISVGSVSSFVEHMEGRPLQMKKRNHPCATDYFPLHLYFIIAALDFITTDVKLSKKGACQLDELVHHLRKTTTHAPKAFDGKVKVDKVKKFVRCYKSLLKLTGTIVTIKQTHKQAYKVVEEQFQSGVARLECVLKKSPYSLDDLFLRVRSNFPQCDSSVLGKTINEFTDSIASQPSSFFIMGQLVFLQKDKVVDPLPLLIMVLGKVKGFIEKGRGAEATYPLIKLVADCGHLPALEQSCLGVTQKEIRLTLLSHPDQFLVVNDGVSLVSDAPSIPMYFMERMQHRSAAHSGSLDAVEVSASSSSQSMPFSDATIESSICDTCSEEQRLYESNIVGDHEDITSFLESLREKSFAEQSRNEMPELMDDCVALQSGSSEEQQCGDTASCQATGASSSCIQEQCLVKIVQVILSYEAKLIVFH